MLLSHYKVKRFIFISYYNQYRNMLREINKGTRSSRIVSNKCWLGKKAKEKWKYYCSLQD